MATTGNYMLHKHQVRDALNYCIKHGIIISNTSRTILYMGCRGRSKNKKLYYTHLRHLHYKMLMKETELIIQKHMVEPFKG